MVVDKIPPGKGASEGEMGESVDQSPAWRLGMEAKGEERATLPPPATTGQRDRCLPREDEASPDRSFV